MGKKIRVIRVNISEAIDSGIVHEYCSASNKLTEYVDFGFDIVSTCVDPCDTNYMIVVLQEQ